MNTMSGKQFCFDKRAESLVAVIREALLEGCNPIHYHPLYIQIYEMTFLGGKYGKFGYLSEREKAFWNCCYLVIDREIEKFQRAKQEDKNQATHTDQTRDLLNNETNQDIDEEVDELRLEPIFTALNKLIRDIRRVAYSISPDMLMSKYVYAKKYFLSFCALMTSPKDHGRMKKCWEDLCAPLTSDDGVGPIPELQDLSLSEGICFICKQNVQVLKRHIRNMHCLVKKRCQECQMFFTSASSFNNHKRDSHKNYVKKHKLMNSGQMNYK